MPFLRWETFIGIWLWVGAGGVYTLHEIRVSPNNGPPPHIHSRKDESFFVLEGESTFRLEMKRSQLSPAHSFKRREALHTVLKTTRNCRRACWCLLPRQDSKIS